MFVPSLVPCDISRGILKKDPLPHPPSKIQILYTNLFFYLENGLSDNKTFLWLAKLLIRKVKMFKEKMNRKKEQQINFFFQKSYYLYIFLTYM